MARKNKLISCSEISFTLDVTCTAFWYKSMDATPIHGVEPAEL